MTSAEARSIALLLTEMNEVHQQRSRKSFNNDGEDLFSLCFRIETVAPAVQLEPVPRLFLIASLFDQK